MLGKSTDPPLTTWRVTFSAVPWKPSDPFLKSGGAPQAQAVMHMDAALLVFFPRDPWSLLCLGGSGQSGRAQRGQSRAQSLH